MEKELQKIEIYERAIRCIDDYFEYRYLLTTQEQNRKDIYQILDHMAAELAAIYPKNQIEK